MTETTNNKVYWVKGNTQPFIIPLEQEVMTEQDEIVAEPYYPDENADIVVNFVGKWMKYTYIPRVDGNLLIFTVNATMPAGNYDVEIVVKNQDGTQYRSQWDNQVVITNSNPSVLREWDEFKQQDITARAALFFFAKGDTGVGIAQGGSMGQVLVKKSNADYDTEWKDAPAEQIPSDWNQTNPSAKDFIKNKPTNLVEDESYIHTDNNYTNEDKQKLAGLENYDDSGIRQELGGKVDKVAGKGLSTNDYTNEDKQKVDSALQSEAARDAAYQTAEAARSERLDMLQTQLPDVSMVGKRRLSLTGFYGYTTKNGYLLNADGTVTAKTGSSASKYRTVYTSAPVNKGAVLLFIGTAGKSGWFRVGISSEPITDENIESVQLTMLLSKTFTGDMSEKLIMPFDGYVAFYRYTDYWSNLTQGVYNTSAIQDNDIIDVSELNGGTTYASLAEALAAVPATLQEGGMTIRFIQTTPAYYNVIKTEDVAETPTGTEVQEALSYNTATYREDQLQDITLPTTVGNSLLYYLAVTETVVDEDTQEETTVTTYTTWQVTYTTAATQKYAQYQLLSTAWSTAVGNWQGVDDEPVAGSGNLVKSGGVYNSIYRAEYPYSEPLLIREEFDDYYVTLYPEKCTFIKEGNSFIFTKPSGAPVAVIGIGDYDYTIQHFLYLDYRLTVDDSFNLVVRTTVSTSSTAVALQNISKGSGSVKLKLSKNIKGNYIVLAGSTLDGGSTLKLSNIRLVKEDDTSVIGKFEQIDERLSENGGNIDAISNSLSSHETRITNIEGKCGGYDSAIEILNEKTTIIDHPFDDSIEILDFTTYGLTSDTVDGAATIEKNEGTFIYRKTSTDYSAGYIGVIGNYDITQNNYLYIDWTLTKDTSFNLVVRDRNTTSGNSAGSVAISKGSGTAKIKLSNSIQGKYIVIAGSTLETGSVLTLSNIRFVKIKTETLKGVIEDLTTYDTEPTLGSVNHVKSGGIATYVNNAIAPLVTDKYDELLKQARYVTTSPTIQSLGLLHFSDIHKDSIAASKILKWLESYSSSIDDLICTGDVVNQYGSKTDSTWYRNTGLPLKALYVLGNHDQCDHGSDGNTRYQYFWTDCGENGDGNIDTTIAKSEAVKSTHKFSFNTYFADYVDGWGVTMPTGYDDPESPYYQACYWHKDYAAQKIRMIGIDCMYRFDGILAKDGNGDFVLDEDNMLAIADNGQGLAKLTTEQETWLYNLLNETLDETSAVYDYSVVCLSHYPLDDCDGFNVLTDKANTNPNGGIVLDYKTTDPVNFHWGYSDSPLTLSSTFDMRNRVANSSSYGFTKGSVNNIGDILQKWQDNGGKFVAWICGHTHVDRFYYPKKYPNLLNIVIDQAGSLREHAIARRNQSEENNNCANFYSIDTQNGYIKIVRLGLTTNRLLRKINFLVYNYKTKIVREEG